MAKQVQCIVRGRVQGVFFRASAQREARRLGLTGWVKNLSDGSVEAVVKAITEKIGKFDRKAIAAALHGAKISAKEHPGVLMDVTFDQNGDVDRESFMVRVENGKQVVFAVVPPIGAK